MGLILPQEVEVKWNGTSRQHYIDKGYRYTNIGDTFICNVLDLSLGSTIKIAVKCDFCDCINYIAYKGYLKLQSDKYCCPECLKHKKKTRDKDGNLIFEEIPYRNPDWLYKEYIEKNRNAEDIANDYSINLRTLREWIHIFGLTEKREKSQNITKEILEDLYSNQHKTTLEIGKIFNLSDATILNLLNKFNIYIPNRSEIMAYYYYEKGGLEKAKEIASDINRRIESSCRQRGISVEDFNGFTHSENQLIRNSSDYKLWAKKVFERDNYTCQCCGKRSKKNNPVNLNAHHLKNFAQNIELRLDVSNGITLCECCHLPQFKGSFHNLYGCTDNTVEQLNEYIDNYKKESEVYFG